MPADRSELQLNHLLLEGSTLAISGALVNRAQQEAASLADAIRLAIEDSVEQLKAAEPDLSSVLSRAERLSKELEHAFQRRCGTTIGSQPRSNASTRGGGDRPAWLRGDRLAEWIADAEHALHSAAHTNVPFFSGKRLQDQRHFAVIFGNLLARREEIEHRALQVAYETYAANGFVEAEASFAARIPGLRAQLDTMTAPLPWLAGLATARSRPSRSPGWDVYCYTSALRCSPRCASRPSRRGEHPARRHR
jgi:hypothetical protein